MDSLDKLLQYIPNQGYFRDYYNLYKNTEVCPRFIFFSAAATLGAVINRKVRFQRGTAETFPPLFPNLWIILVAPQGRGHKSTALNTGRRLMNKLPEELAPKILASKLTPEVLIKSLASQKVAGLNLPAHVNQDMYKESAIAVLYSSELGVMLDKKKYNEGFIPLITDLYDCDDEWSSATVMRGDQKLYNICLTLMGASTPDWMQSMLPQDAFKGGFMSRVLLISMPQEWNKKVSDPPTVPKEDVDKVIKHLADFAQMNGDMTWTPTAKQFFHAWYLQSEKEKENTTGPVSAYLERKQNHFLKLAMLLQITKPEKQLILQVETLEYALRMLNIVEDEVKPVIDFIATEPRMRSVQRILEVMRTHKRLAESDLLRMVWRYFSHPREWEDAISILVRSRELAMKPDMINSDKELEAVGYEHIGK